MVTCQIYEGDHFRGTLTDLLCRSRLAVIDNLKEGVITQDWDHCNFLYCHGGSILTSPLLLKPRISKLMLDVRPVWISCKCLKRLSLALPRPLSSSPWVKTPSRVDLPESTLPRTATRRSKNWWAGGKGGAQVRNRRSATICKKHILTIPSLTCWSSGTFRIRTSAILRDTSKSYSTSCSLRTVMSAPTLSAMTEKQTR